MSDKQPQTIPVGNKGTVVVNPTPLPPIDLSNGSAGIKKEDLYNAGGTSTVHRGAPASQDGSTKKRRKKKKKRVSSGSY